MVGLEFPEEKKLHVSGSTQHGPWSKGGRRLILENWAARGLTGWVGGAADIIWCSYLVLKPGRLVSVSRHGSPHLTELRLLGSSKLSGHIAAPERYT